MYVETRVGGFFPLSCYSMLLGNYIYLLVQGFRVGPGTNIRAEDSWDCEAQGVEGSFYRGTLDGYGSF